MVTSRFPRDSSRMPPADDGLQRWLPKAIMAAAIGMGAWLGTEWFWHFSSGSTISRAGTAGQGQVRQKVDMANAAESVVGAQLFGAPKAAAVATAQVSTLNIKLKGVFAGDPARPAFAIVNTGSRDEFALAGRELMPGVKLDSVHATHVLVNRNGTIERVNLEERALSSGSAPRLSPAMMAPRPAPRVTPPPPPPPSPPAMNAPAPGEAGQPGQPGGQPGAPSVNLNNISPQTNFGRIGMRGDGVAVEAAPPGSMLANLGLQPGDVIRSVNGQPVTNEADLARIAQQAAMNPSVQAEVMRDGKVVPLQAQLRR